jgi:hypothetical protein
MVYNGKLMKEGKTADSLDAQIGFWYTLRIKLADTTQSN